MFQFKKLLLYTFVAVMLLVNKVWIRIIPFKKLITFYANSSIGVQCDEVEKEKVMLIHSVMERFNRILIWKALCFEKSLTVMVLAHLFHLPGTVYFGIKKSNSGEVLAHAWSQIGCYWITGYINKDEFTVVYKMYYIPDKLVK